MKNLFYSVCVVVGVLITGVSPIRAQMPSGGANPMNTAMLKLFGEHTNFTATAAVSMESGDKSEAIGMTFGMAMLEGKVRAEMDMAKMKNKMFSPEIVAQMKAMGADRTTYIVRPDKKVSYLIYPGLNAYVQMPMSEVESQAFTKEPKMKITSAGKETIDNHPCVKNKVVVTDDQGKTQEAMVWNATDLKNFPIQMEMKEGDSTVKMKYQDIQFKKPDAKQFDAPANMKKYDNMQQLQQVMMQKMMSAPGKP